MSEFLTRQITVRGETVTVYSCDGWRWFSNRIEAAQCQRRREKFLQERSRSLKKSAVFVSGTRAQRKMRVVE